MTTSRLEYLLINGRSWALNPLGNPVCIQFLSSIAMTLSGLCLSRITAKSLEYSYSVYDSVYVMYHWLREKVEKGLLKLQSVPTRRHADVLTKCLSRMKHEKCRTELGICRS